MKSIVLFFLFLGGMNLFSQEKILTINNDTIIPHFDLSLYDSLSKHSECWCYTKDSLVITFYAINHFYNIEENLMNTYKMEKKVENSYFSIISDYDKDSLYILRWGTFFKDIKIGCHYHFDENHHVVSKTNYDSIYVQSIDDIRFKIYKKYGFDIFDVNQQTWVFRSNNELPIYDVILNKRKKYHRIKLTIDATSGKILKKERVIDDKAYNSIGEINNITYYYPSFSKRFKRFFARRL
jgi:hypothetical protein